MDSKLLDKLLFYGFVGLVLYLLYQKFAGSLTSTTSTTATAGGSALQKLLNPTAANYSAGMQFNTVFPDGSRHAVDPSWINPADNSFVWPGDGQTYILATGASGATAAYLASSVVQSTADMVNAANTDVTNLGAYRKVNPRVRRAG
jgi:hypothetical protein